MRFRTVIAACVLAACAPGAPSIDGASDLVALAGITVTAPSDSGWTMLVADERQVAFGWTGDSSSAELRAELVSDDSTADDDAFLEAAEARQEEALLAGGLEMVSVHFNGARLGGAVCLQYDGIYRDPEAGEPARAYRTVEGYLCRHPHTAGQGFDLRLVHEAGRRGAPGLEQAMLVAEAFFRSAVFPS